MAGGPETGGTAGVAMAAARLGVKVHIFCPESGPALDVAAGRVGLHAGRGVHEGQEEVRSQEAIYKYLKNKNYQA